MTEIILPDQVNTADLLLEKFRSGPSFAALAQAQRSGDTSSDMDVLKLKLGESHQQGLDLVIAFDTNCLKSFRRQPLLLQSILDAPKESVQLVIPGQAYVEYYNNHTAFSQETYTKYNTDLKKLSQALESEVWTDVSKLGFIDTSELKSYQLKLNEFLDDYKPDSNRNYIEATLNAIDELIKAPSLVPFVPREKFYDLGKVRLESKLPPGWADVKSKGSQALGDFYCWADLLLALIEREVGQKSATSKLVVFVSDDVSKSDWSVGSFAHPFLAAECLTITGYSLFKISVGDLPRLVEAVNQTGNKGSQ